MTDPAGEGAARLRLDRLLVYLRFARTRSAARAMIEAGTMRLNGDRITKISREVAAGDVVTLARGQDVIVFRIDSLPDRRLPPAEAARRWSRIV